MTMLASHARPELIDEARAIAAHAATHIQDAAAVRLDHAAELLRDSAMSCRGVTRTQLPDRDRIAASCEMAARLLELAAAELVAGRCDGSPVTSARRYAASALTSIDDVADLLPAAVPTAS